MKRHSAPSLFSLFTTLPFRSRTGLPSRAAPLRAHATITDPYRRPVLLTDVRKEGTPQRPAQLGPLRS